MITVMVIGVGPSDEELLTGYARKKIVDSDLVLTTKKLRGSLGGLNSNTIECPLSQVAQRILEAGEKNIVSVLVSGDIGFYSVSKTLREQLSGRVVMKFVNGISSLQYLAAKLQTSYDNIKVINAHDRENLVVPAVCYNQRVFVLTGEQCKARDIITQLNDAGLAGLTVTVGEDLSGAEERIITSTAGKMMYCTFDDLAVMLIENRFFVDPFNRIPDSQFSQGKTPMTEETVRWVSLANLGTHPKDTVYDIGAGAGEVSIEMARMAHEGMVFAIEQDDEATTLIEENKRRFGAYNVKTIHALAPEGLEDLPPANRAFIRGSDGRLREIVHALLAKNLKMKIVFHAVSQESLQEAVACFKAEGLEVESTCLNVSKAENPINDNMMKAHNPVYVISGVKSNENG